MAKKVAVLAVNPVNGFGLFQYLEAFFENGISYKVYAVAETKQIKTNSGVELVADDIIAHLVGHEDEFDAVVFSCGDAVPVFAQNADKPYNIDLMSVRKVRNWQCIRWQSRPSPRGRRQTINLWLMAIFLLHKMKSLYGQ